MHYHQAKVTSSPANTLLASPITIKTAQKDIVIGVSVAGTWLPLLTHKHMERERERSIRRHRDTHRDGEKEGTSREARARPHYSPFPLLTLPPPLVSTASKPDDAYFKADVSVCGYSYVSEPTKWRCTNAPTPNDAWLSADFDDSAWAPAAVKVRHQFSTLRVV